MAGERQIEGVERPLFHVFPDFQRGVLIRLKSRYLRPAGPGAGANLRGGKAVRIVEGDVPCAFAAHGEAAQQDALAVDVKALPDGSDGFKDVGFTGPMPAGAV